MARIILKIFGRMCTSTPWLTFSGNTNNGHARRIKVSHSDLHYVCILVHCATDLNERDSLEAVWKQVRKMILRGLGE